MHVLRKNKSDFPCVIRVTFSFLKIREASVYLTEVVICGDHYFQPDTNKGETISNVMFVQFYSNHELSNSGFELSFKHSKGTIRYEYE